MMSMRRRPETGMTKLIIQIPCFNEEQTLPITLRDLPSKISGIDIIETLVVNDGSTDGTVKAARAGGVDHIIDLPRNRGLANAFITGLDACLGSGADIIVNADADNQYDGRDIEALVRPILEGRADIVVGARPIDDIAHFSAAKKLLQKLGSWAVRAASGTDVPDAPSGFRAISRDAAMRLNVFSTHTYTLETIIQAGQKGIPITSVPVRVNPDLRPSRLIKSIPSYVLRSVFIILRIFMVYRPLRFFLLLGGVPFLLGVFLGARWFVLAYFFPDPGRTYLPSLILAAVLMLTGVQTWFFGLIADLKAVNRTLLEEIRLRQRRADLERRTGGP
jgi:glycosyltransferase involved in cell wall biosynthesis